MQTNFQLVVKEILTTILNSNIATIIKIIRPVTVHIYLRNSQI